MIGVTEACLNRVGNLHSAKEIFARCAIIFIVEDLAGEELRT